MTDGRSDPQSVLVVDDDEGVRALTTVVLRRAGFQVIEAASGTAAIDIIAAQRVDVVVCDLAMPGMSGLDLIRAIRHRPETATLPVLLVTGSGDDRSVIEGLDAGADDFLSKPVRLDELVARVRAHIRTHDAWAKVVQDELRVRSGVVAALGVVRPSAVPEETAETVVAELASRTGSDFISVAQVMADGRMQELATFNPREGVTRGGDAFSPERAAYLIGKARTGPWVDDVRTLGPTEPTAALQAANLDLIASAPIFAGADIVGLLSIGAVADDARSLPSRRARLLAPAIDYASVVSAFAGSALIGRREASVLRGTIERIIADGTFHPVFQPIVEVDSGDVVGFEALTRFDDGTPPPVRFGEAGRVDLGAALELAALTKAIDETSSLPADAFVSINVSPAILVDSVADIRAAVARAGRLVVIELTEHVAIDDYDVLRGALAEIGDGAQLAVDDAGAGYSSLRHILELRPSFAKLDISLVRGIDADDLRQALAAGLNYYALRTGCRLIAEGVETSAEAEALKGLGIEFAQGYLYGRPERLRRPGRP